MSPTSIRRVLMMRGGALGDFVLTLPAIQALHELHPDAEFALLAHPAHISLAVAEGLVAGGRSLESGELAGFFQDEYTPNAEWCAWFHSFDLIVSWLYDPMRIFAGHLPTDVLVLREHRCLSSQIPAALQLGGRVASYRLRSSRDMIREHRVTLHPGSGSPRKNWAPERWAEVLHELHVADPSWKISIIAGEADTEVLTRLLPALESLPFDVCTHLSVPELAVHLAGSELFLGHDSGPAHLAAACGTRCALVFGPEEPRVWAPQGSHVRVLACRTPLEVTTAAFMAFFSQGD